MTIIEYAHQTLLSLPLENSPIVIEDALTRDWVHFRPEVIKLLQKREIHFQSMSIVLKGMMDMLGRLLDCLVT